MSISETDFDRWITAEYAERGAFTAFAVLVRIGRTSVTPLCSTYFNVIGDEIDWDEIIVLFAGAGAEFPQALQPRFHHARLVAEAEIVVRREDQHLAAPLHDYARGLRRVEVIEALVDSVRLELVQLPLQLGPEGRVQRHVVLRLVWDRGACAGVS